MTTTTTTLEHLFRQAHEHGARPTVGLVTGSMAKADTDTWYVSAPGWSDYTDPVFQAGVRCYAATPEAAMAAFVQGLVAGTIRWER